MEKTSPVFETFGSRLSEICSVSPLAEKRPLRWTIIANPKAGGFTIAGRWKKHLAALENVVQKTRSFSTAPDAGPSLTAKREGNQHGLVFTKEAGHAGAVTASVIAEALEPVPHVSNGKPLNLIITAGGDGTSLEVLTALYERRESLGGNFAVLRLPMGTGNDGADAFKLEDALGLLTKPSELAYRRALRLTSSTPGKGPFMAFNILSVGLDAFVTHMTNRMKGKLPGDSYKLWVDIAALFYDKLYKVGPMSVRAFDNAGGEIKTINEKILLMAMGESGRRSYGSRKWILPDDRNVCILKQMPLLRKLALKGLFNSGGHIDKPESIPFSAGRIEFSCENPILAQMDGETVLLEPKDFPAAIELTGPVIPVLTLKTA